MKLDESHATIIAIIADKLFDGSVPLRTVEVHREELGRVGRGVEPCASGNAEVIWNFPDIPGDKVTRPERSIFLVGEANLFSKFSKAD